jgi:SAM-dependent methyltransferase
MKKQKKYQLHNSYFKVNKMLGLPDTMLEIENYRKENNGDLPFNYSGDNWLYDAFCERQKYRGVQNSQYLTPDAVVDRMLNFAGKYFNDNLVLEPCCGTGQITKELIKDGYAVSAFDDDVELYQLCQMLYGDKAAFYLNRFEDLECGLFNQIIANPPYEVPILTAFLHWILGIQTSGGISILLLPKGFIRKDKPKDLVTILHKFGILEIEDASEPFLRTATRAEIVVLKKL